MKRYIGTFLALLLSVFLFAQEPVTTEPPALPVAEPSQPVTSAPEAETPVQPVEPPTVQPGMDMKKWEEQLPQPMSEEKSQQISKYFEEALQNYEEILSQEKASEVKTTEKRIEANARLLEEQKGKLSASEAALRKMRLEYTQRYLMLKNSFEKGRIDKKTYDRELEKIAQEYRFKMGTFVSDRDFYKGEATKTEERLRGLEEYNRINRIVMEQEGGPKPEKPMNAFESLMQEVKALGCFETRNFCTSPEFK